MVAVVEEDGERFDTAEKESSAVDTKSPEY